MKNKLLFNLLTPFATSKPEGKTFRNLLALVMVVLGMGFSWGQTTIISNVTGGGNLPTNWTSFNGNTTEVIDKTSYYLVETTTLGLDQITTGNYDLSAYSYIKLNVDITSFGSGAHNALKVEVSSASGSTFTALGTSYLTAITTTSNVTQNLVISAPPGGFSTTTKFRFSNSASSGRGIRITNINANAPTQASNVTFSSVSISGFILNWTDGSNNSSGRRAVFVAATSSGSAVPINGTTYTANTTFGSGTQIGSTGWFCVYNNTGTHVSGVSVAGLTNGTTYRVMVCENEGTGSTSVYNTITASNNPNNQATTSASSNSDVSDIIIHSSFTEPTNIAYASTQENSNLTEGNSLEVAKFTLRDGGATNDTDSNSTTLNAITFTIANHTNLRRLALYDGSAELSEVAISAGTATFSSLTLAAGDNSTKDFSLRASFAGTVTDNSQFSFTVSSVTADIAGSTFAAANAGAAASSTIGDRNKIIVTADRLSFAQQTSNVTLNTAMSPAPTVSANDALGNRDLDFTSSIRITSTGTLSGTPVDVIANSGLATFNSLTHTANGSSLTLNAERTSGLDWDVTSSTFDITVQAPGLLLTDDDFNYTVSSNIITVGTGWGITSSNTTKVNTTSTSNGLTMTNYPCTNSTGISFIAGSGEDVAKSFTAQTSGSIYASTLINLSSAGTAGYVFGFTTTNTSTTYEVRLQVRTVSGNLNFGISRGSGTITWDATNYSLNTTYFVAVKLTLNASSNDDSIDLFVSTSITNSEPSTPNATITGASDVASIAAVFVRQDAAAGAGRIDGIRVATNWGTLVGNPQYSDNTTIAAGNYNSITTYNGSTPSISGNVNLYGQLSILGGTLTTNNTLTLKSNANGTAQVAAIGSGGSITGNVTVERYIPSGKRAFRLLSPAVTTTNFISNNWQGQTHITGGASGGFDVTETNLPSMFTYNNNAASGTGWTAIANTDATNLTAGVGYRVLVRGDRTATNITAASADAMNAAITLSATGTLKTGEVALSSGTTPAINNTLNTTTNGFSLVGNPYQSAVDWNAVTKSGIDATYWAWDPNMGSTLQRGRYVSFNGTVNSVIDGIGSSNVGRYIQPGQAFFVKNTTLGTEATLTFQEAHKASTNANVFRTNNQTESTNFATLSTALYDPNELAIGGYPIDAMKAVFGSAYTNELGLGDATKLEAAGENIAWFRNNTKLAIDAAAPVTTSDELVMKTIRLGANKNYTFKIQTTNFDTALTPYLVDNFLNTQTEISTSQAYLATFATTSNVASYNENRFKIVFQNAVLSTDTFATQIGVYPNPSKGNGFYLQLPSTAQATVRLYNTLGQEIAISHNEGHYQAKQSLAAGVYHIMVTQGEKTSKLKWIVE